MGILLGLVSSATFGLIPLFTLPLLGAGITVETTLVYRFAIATLVMGLVLLCGRQSLLLPLKSIFKIMVLSTLYLFAVVLFFHAFSYLASGVVATIQFLYPVMVLIIMVLFFHERFHWHLAISIALAVLGVAILFLGPGLESTLQPEEGLSSSRNIFWGILLSLLAGLGNALYFVGIQVAKLPNINGLIMTFYVMLFGTLFCFGNALLSNSLQWIGNPEQFCIACLLAIVTAVISNLTLILAIRRIGSTIVSILGVMEPLTAVAVGILVFGEAFTSQLAIGIILVVLSVFLVILWPRVSGRTD